MKNLPYIYSAISFGDHIICVTDSPRLLVLDTLLNIDPPATRRLSHINAYGFVSRHDSSFIIAAHSKSYLVNSDLGLTQLRPSYPFPVFDDIYEDSAFTVSGCCAGEWGSAVTFVDKATKIKYSLPATCPQQVFRHKDYYVLTSYITHLGAYASITSIKEPKKLYEIVNNRNICNWYSADSVREKYEHDAPREGINCYAYGDVYLLATFHYNNVLYSVFSTKFATFLAQHDEQRIVIVDTLMDEPILSSNGKVFNSKNVTITALHAYNNFLLLYIRNNIIRILKNTN